MKPYRSEHGQALVLIILAMVGLLGVSALAIDYGQIYSVRRMAQNAADAAALAAAYNSTQPNPNFRNAALKLLMENGFTEDMDTNENLDKVRDVQVYNPPISGPYATAKNKNQFFQVIIRTRVDKIFSQFVFSGNEDVTVEAVARAVPSDAASPGNALHAIGRNVCPGIIFNGGSNTNISGGNIYSNSNGHDNSGSCASGIMTGSSGTINVTNGDIDIAGSWIQNAGAVVSPTPKTYVDPSYPAEMSSPNCTGLPTRDDSSNALQPGNYPNGIRIQSGAYTMAPGLYCLGSDFTVNGGSLTGTGVMVYMKPTAGGINFGGNGAINLSTGSQVLDASGKNYSGFLIFMDKDNHNGVDVSGSSGSYYHGTIYAPGYRDPDSAEKCNIGGTNSSISLRSNVICYTIGIAGNASVTIDYKPEENYRMPPTVELSQ